MRHKQHGKQLAKTGEVKRIYKKFPYPVFIVPGKFSSLDLFSRIDVFLVVLMDLFSSEILAILLLTIIRKCLLIPFS